LNQRLFSKLQLQQGEKEMMKKLGMFAFVLALVVVFAMPASAIIIMGSKGETFSIGGSLRYDIGMRYLDKDRNAHVPDYMTSATSGNERTYFFNGISTSTNLTFSFLIGDVSGFANIFTQVSPGYYHHDMDDRALSPTTVNTPYSTATGGTAFTNYSNNAQFDLVYGTYKFGSFLLQAGRLPALTVVQVPNPSLGYLTEAGGHINGIAYGYVYERKVPALRLTQYVNKTFNWAFQVAEPGVWVEDANPLPAPAAGSAQTVGQASNVSLRESYAKIPAFGARIGMNFGPASINPGFYWAETNWNDLPAGWDRNMNSWFVRLPVRLTFGPFVALFEGLYGQNLGGLGSNHATPCSSETVYSMYKRTPTGQIWDANTLNLWGDLAYTIGPITPHLYYGYVRYTNDNAFKAVPNSDTEQIRTFWGVNAPYMVTPNFTVVPEFSLYNLGNVPGIGVKDYKLGTDWLLGVQFQFNF
jgi:hypothetical protein